MKHLPRGIAPDLLISQVRNTMPYLFEEEVDTAALERFIPTQVLRALDRNPTQPLNHFEYFKLCLCSHYLTCGTPVPTDVDNQIRFKLWPSELPVEIAVQMAQLVLESRFWDFTAVSTRYVSGASGDWESQVLSGHLGEWFTVSCAAYCALKNYADPLAQAKRKEIFENIGEEVRRHSEIFGSLWRAHEGLSCLKASASIAHNFGDLDRVMDMWELSIDDPLRLEFYKLGILPFDSDRKLRYLGRLWVAGELYKSSIMGSSMAFENHRHFALRKPRCLRRNPKFLIPTGPFFDNWGKTVALGLCLQSGKPSEDTLEVASALMIGWQRLAKSVGYGRVLRSFKEIHPEIDLSDLQKNSTTRSLLDLSQDQFEKRWNDEALKQMDDIPSRA